MLTDYFTLSLRNLRQRKLRSWLTILGIVISVAIIFILISLSVGLREAINEQFKTLGTDKFFIMAKGQAGAPGSGGAVQLTEKDVDVVEKVTGVRDVSYAVVGNAKIDFGKDTRYLMVIGLPVDKLRLYTESTSLKLEEGRMIEEGDSGEVTIGWDYKFNKVFSKPVEVGDTLEINGVSFRVRGIMGRIGNPSDDKNIFLPLEDFKDLFNSSDRVDQIIVQVQDESQVKEIAERTEQKLRRSRWVNEKTQDFSISTPEELLQSFDAILNIITVFLIGVAAISLLVGSIGIANTMYTSVLERTKEIGTMKAIGAKNSDVLLIFLIESGLIGLVGGLIGLGIGFGVAKAIEFVAINQLNTTLLKAAAPVYLVIGCLAFGFLIGGISGSLPAYRASKLRPVDALRYE